MQSLPVYLYTNLFEVTLDLDDNTKVRQVMYQRPIKIQKGVKNTIQLQFKNSDQKRLTVRDKIFKMYVYDSSNESRQLVLTKHIEVLDIGSTATIYPSKGLGSVVFTDKDIHDLDSKPYDFSIVTLENDGSETPTYSNTYYDVSGVLEIKDEVYPDFIPSIEISNFQRFYNASVGKAQWEYDTGNIRMYPDNLKKSAIHTVASYMRNFKGTVLVEGTLENNPSTFGRYAVISTKVYNNFTGIDYTNFNGLFTYIKVTYIPSKNPVDGRNDDVTYTGYFDKVLIRS